MCRVAVASANNTFDHHLVGDVGVVGVVLPGKQIRAQQTIRSHFWSTVGVHPLRIKSFQIREFHSVHCSMPRRASAEDKLLVHCTLQLERG